MENAMSTPMLVVLAGGASSRLWPLSDKSLIRFGAEPLLAKQLKNFVGLGFSEAIIVANPENKAAIESITQEVDGLTAQIVVQENPKGMGDALLQIEPVLESHESIYVTQVHDVVENTLHQEMLNGYNSQPEVSYIAGYEIEEYFPGGYLIVGDGGRISGVIEKPGADNRPSNLVNIVAHIHADVRALLERIKVEYASDTPADDHYERAMAHLMQERVYQIVAYSGEWNALKYPWHVLDIMNHYLSQLGGQTVADSAFIHSAATISGNVFIGEGAKVFAGAAVVGPAYIGAGTIVGNNALVRSSMVLDKCEVGFTTEIARSYVGRHVGMHACRVLDSVFADHVNFSAGCTTANLRIDKGNISSMVKGQKVNTGRNKLGAIIGENTFISVDAMTMPGVKIGVNAQVGPTTNVLHDVKDRHRLYVVQDVKEVVLEEYE
jgi:bifunctional UDP-N-acetylglucosamine pyrophosphorylase/glucosamine-1-phosphate N-acetyltransferase